MNLGADVWQRWENWVAPLGDVIKRAQEGGEPGRV